MKLKGTQGGSHGIPGWVPMGSQGGEPMGGTHGIPGWALGDPLALGDPWALGDPGPWGIIIELFPPLGKKILCN